MKRSRPLSLFLSVLILISCFTVSVSASDSENLIDSNLTNWGNIDPDFTKVTQHNDNNGNTFYQVTFKPQVVEGADTWLRFGQLYDISSLTAGNSYTLKYHLFDYDDLLNSGITANEDWFWNGILKYEGQLVIGVGSYSDTVDWVNMIEGYYVVINKDNYKDFFGKNNTFTFELPTVSNPAIYIYYCDTIETGNTTAFYFSDFSLIDNEAAKEEGFLSKLFAWFQEKFDSIGESFANLGNKLTELKNSFLDSLSNLGDTIGSFFDEQLEGIKEFFRGFGNLILYFNWEGEYTNPFKREDSPIDKVSEFFDNLIEYVDSIGTSIENVLDSITGGLHIFDEFTSRFPWLKGIAVFCLALIVITRFIGL